MLKLIEIVILWDCYTFPFGLSFFRNLSSLFFKFFIYFPCLGITDEGSIPEMRIWSILYIESDSKWCMHLSRSLFVFQLLGECHCWWTKEFPGAHVANFYGRLRLICSVLRASKLSVLKLIEIVFFGVYYTFPFGLSFFRHFWIIIFPPFEILCLAKDHWREFSIRNAHTVHIVNWIRFKMVYAF